MPRRLAQRLIPLALALVWLSSCAGGASRSEASDDALTATDGGDDASTEADGLIDLVLPPDLTNDTTTEDAMVNDAALPDGVEPSDGADGNDDASIPPLDQSSPDLTPLSVPARYRESDGLHSPITKEVLARLQQIAASNPGRNDRVFMKVGDSITDTSWFLYCFDGTRIDLDGRDSLQPTIDHFKLDLGLGTDESSWNRDSESMLGGKTAYWAVTGNPSPIANEIAAINPRFAIVMMGTNDIGWFGTDTIKTFEWYRGYMEKLLDQLIASGVIPVVMAIPPYKKTPLLDSWAHTLNAMVRGFAEQRQIPFVDFHTPMLSLPGFGLAPDQIHPNIYYPDASSGGCYFTTKGLEYGFNLRNLLTLEAFDRVRRAMFEPETTLDPTPPPLPDGDGSIEKPFVIDGFPYSDRRNTALSPHRVLASYSGCNATQDESGPEYVYRFELNQKTRIRAIVLDGDGGSVDVDLHLLAGAPTEAACLERNDKTINAELDSGVYYLVLDTYVSGGTELPGEYLLVIHRCLDDDDYCL